jgi:hypothetical protein
MALLSAMVPAGLLPSLCADPVVAECPKGSVPIRKARFIVSVGEGDDRIRLARVREIPDDVGELVVGGIYYDGDVFGYSTTICGWADEPCKDVTLGRIWILLKNAKEQMPGASYVEFLLNRGWAVI